MPAKPRNLYQRRGLAIANHCATVNFTTHSKIYYGVVFLVLQGPSGGPVAISENPP